MNLDLFKEEILKLGITISDFQVEKLEKYYNLLVHWNNKMNLTAITDKELVYLKHFYDSLTISKVIDLNDVSSLCDIGTGAGFPGLVLKIFYPHLKVILVDSLLKRINFLKEVVSELGLDDVEILHVRAEDYARSVRGKFDVVTARAVSSFNVLLEYCIPLVKTSKYFIAMRGVDDTNNDDALRVLNCTKVNTVSFKLPVEESVRTIVKIKKNGETPLKFPRKNSIIKKYPL